MTTRISAPDAFAFEWADPADAGWTWEWDEMHLPVCLTPLAGDYALLLAETDAYSSRRLDVPYVFHGLVVHGYCYFHGHYDVPDAELAATRERSAAIFRGQVALTDEYWSRALVELRELYAWIDAVQVDQVTNDALGAGWDGAWARARRAWEIHHRAIIGPYASLDMLADIYESVVPDAPPGEAMRLTQGTVHELTDVDAGLDRLSDLVRRDPALSVALSKVSSGADLRLDDVAAAPGGPAFLIGLHEFLDQHGHLGQPWDDLTQPSWAEEPTRLLAELSQRSSADSEPAYARAARLTAEAESLADRFRARAADHPSTVEEFDRRVAMARQIGHLTETHNYWIDRMCQARLRALSLRIGRWLVGHDVVDRPEDVFFLHRAEVSGILRRPVDERATVEGRRAAHRHWSGVTPPRVIGRAKSEGGANRFTGDTVTTVDDAVIRGTGASAGIARGPARVVLGLDDFGRVRPGDVIVAPSSNPSWVPLFAIAAGLVTNTGGVVSHAAVVARELALPAVVGTGDATSRIADGQVIELDGTTGDVRLL